MPALKLFNLPVRILSRSLDLAWVRWLNFRRRNVSLPFWKAKRRVRQIMHGGEVLPLVSVVIPAHNAATTLPETLQSLTAQRIRAWEAIIVDDGSTDATPAVVASAQARDARIRCVRQPQSGVSHARNTGLLHARAERVMFLDADDWIATDYFEQMFAVVAEDPKVDVVYCGYIRVADDGPKLPMSFSPEVATTPFEAFGHHCATAIHCLVLRRQLVLQVGSFDETLKTCEDWDLWLRIARTGASFVGIPLPLAYYRLRPGSATSNYVHMIRDALRVLERSRTTDCRVRRPDPRYVDGLRDDAVTERWTYFAIWCAACEAANGRTGVPALELLGPLPDMKDNTDGITDCLFHGLTVGGRRPPWAVAEIWLAAEPFLLQICERFESASIRPGLTRSIMERLETQVVRASNLAGPLVLWRMVGYRIDLREPIPDIEWIPQIDNVYLKVTDGNTCLDEISYPLLGPISSRDVARLILEAWGFGEPFWDGSFSTRMRLARKVTADIAHRVRRVLRIRRARRKQLLETICIAWRAIRSGRLLRAANAQPSVVQHEAMNQKRATPPMRMLPTTLNHGSIAQAELGTLSATPRRAVWDQRFEMPDPWHYTTPYERTKYDRTLALLPEGPIARAMELACAEGHFTDRLALRVGSLFAVDISEKALGRARNRCISHTNVTFHCLDLVDDVIPGQMDLIVCSEVLYFLENIAALRRVAKKLTSALASGGRIVTAHAFVLSDDQEQTGFDWSNPFGAKTIDKVFSETAGLQREKSLITELYRIDVYRRQPLGVSDSTPDIRVVPLDSLLEPEVERNIVWGGAAVRRSEAVRCESTEYVPILMYHSVSDSGASELARYRVSPRVFEQQLQFLRQQGYYAIDTNDLLKAMRSGEPLPGRPIMLTFDDAYADFYEGAWPLLQRYDFQAQVFVVTDKVGGCADWDSSYGQPAPLMGWDEIESLHKKGVSFGSHLATHCAVDCLSTEELLREGASSRVTLETRLGTVVHSVAFPFGIYNSRTVNTLKMSGYEIGVTTSDGIASIGMDPMTLPRIEIMNSDDLEDFAWKIGRHDVLGGIWRW